MKFRGLACGLLISSLGLFTSCGSNDSGTNPPPSTASALFVAAQGDKSVSAFSIDGTTGKLTAKGTAVATGNMPSALILNPAGDTAFVTNPPDGTVSTYSVKADGTLTTGSTTTTGGTNPVSMAIDAAGTRLFVVNQGPPGGASTITVFTVSGTSLTAVGTPFPTTVGGMNPLFPSADDAVSIAVTPDGKFLYVASRLYGGVVGFSVDPSGQVNVPGTIVKMTGTIPTAMGITPNGNFLYVANAGSNNVSAFSICDNLSTTCVVADGTLEEVPGSPFTAQSEPSALAIDPDNNFVYVVDKGSNQVSGYKIGQASGVLTSTSPAFLSTGLTPTSVTIPPGGVYLYIANSGSSSISLFQYDTTTGALSAKTPVSAGVQPTSLAAK